MPRRFVKQFVDLGYAMQLGWYVEGLLATRRKVNGASVIAVETSPPYCVVVWEIPQHIIDWGRAEAIEMARKYRCCEACGSWPGVADGRQIMELPEWATAGAAVLPKEEMEASEL
jgi:hypothetical protein